MLGPERRRVVDLGAGTGIFTRILSDLGHDVVAVEPDPAMRARLAAVRPGVTTLPGAAEEIPLPDRSVDAVVAAQAYHWFSRDRAHREIARALRAGGVFAPVWNIRDESVPWVAELSRVAGSDAAGLLPETIELGPPFAPPERFETRHRVTHDMESLVSLISSRSYYLTASPQGREQLSSAVRQLAGTLPARFELPYVTVAFRAVRLPAE